MPAYKDKEKGTWYASFYYEDWTGKKVKKLKRGFSIKRDALEWERTFLQQQTADLEMTFENFVALYAADMKGRIKENTWGTKEQTSAKYISEKCGKVTISVLNNQMPMMPLFSPVYSSTRPYSQTRSNTQRDLMNPDEVLRLENRKCLALFKGHKPALLYKMTPEELPDYAGLTTCRVIEYIPEWRRKEAEPAPQKRPQAPAQKEPSSIPKMPAQEKQPDRSGPPPDYDLAEDDEIGMVECTVESIRGL